MPTARKRHRPYSQWPGDAQVAFEIYYSMDGKTRDLSDAAALAGISKQQITRWSSQLGYASEVERRDKALAEEARAKITAQRRKVLEATEGGVGALLIRYSAAAQGKCPVCMGHGTVKQRMKGAGATLFDVMCEKCEGAGTYDPMNLNMLAYDRAINRYGIMTGDLADPQEGPRGTLSHDDWAMYQKEMLEKSGAKVARMMAALHAVAEPEEAP